jgi:hypothetical protein
LGTSLITSLVTTTGVGVAPPHATSAMLAAAAKPNNFVILFMCHFSFFVLFIKNIKWLTRLMGGHNARQRETG